MSGWWRYLDPRGPAATLTKRATLLRHHHRGGPFDGLPDGLVASIWNEAAAFERDDGLRGAAAAYGWVALAAAGAGFWVWLLQGTPSWLQLGIVTAAVVAVAAATDVLRHASHQRVARRALTLLRARRGELTTCPACGYDLSNSNPDAGGGDTDGTDIRRCSECGLPVPPPVIVPGATERKARRVDHLLAQSGVAAGGSAVFAWIVLAAVFIDALRRCAGRFGGGPAGSAALGLLLVVVFGGGLALRRALERRRAARQLATVEDVGRGVCWRCGVIDDAAAGTCPTCGAEAAFGQDRPTGGGSS